MGPVPTGEDGFMLLGLIVAIAIILLVLGVAASKVAFSLQREREVESARRANQYVRAIRVFYRKTGHYPASIEQLENTNNIRFLRQDYIDPLTGKNDWRLIAVGQNKTTVKGFFGAAAGGDRVGRAGRAGGEPVDRRRLSGYDCWDGRDRGTGRICGRVRCDGRGGWEFIGDFFDYRWREWFFGDDGSGRNGIKWDGSRRNNGHIGDGIVALRRCGQQRADYGGGQQRDWRLDPGGE